MSRASEYLLKAENYAMAAKMAEGQKRLAFLGAAAYWRNKAFQAQMDGFRRLHHADDQIEPASNAVRVAD
jgi:hypothetical protein